MVELNKSEYCAQCPACSGSLWVAEEINDDTETFYAQCGKCEREYTFSLKDNGAVKRLTNHFGW